jgi:succinyl-CoA synthetase alpha subunit
MAKNEDVDVITGDWMSECNMTVRGNDKQSLSAQKASSKSTSVAYEQSFVDKVDPAIPWLAKRGIKMAVNAGASDVVGLADAVKLLVKKHGVDLKVGYVDGDDVTDAVLEAYRNGTYLKMIAGGLADKFR